MVFVFPGTSKAGGELQKCGYQQMFLPCFQTGKSTASIPLPSLLSHSLNQEVNYWTSTPHPPKVLGLGGLTLVLWSHL